MKIKGIIFDVDGTLADTEEIHRRAFNQAFREVDLGCWDKKKYIELLAISGGRERIKHFLQQDKQWNAAEPLDQFCRNLHRRKSEIYREKLMHSRIKLRPGVKRLLNEALDKKICIGIATSSSQENLLTLLHSTLGKHSLSWFNTIVTSDVVVDKKPSPVVYQFALANLGIPPDYCVAIEDSSNGNKAALAAGLKTVITTHQFTAGSKFSGASIVADKLGEAGDTVTFRASNTFKKQYIDLELLDLILSEDHATEETQDPPHEQLVMVK